MSEGLWMAVQGTYRAMIARGGGTRSGGNLSIRGDWENFFRSGNKSPDRRVLSCEWLAMICCRFIESRTFRGEVCGFLFALDDFSLR